MTQHEKYVDYNNKSMKLLGFVRADVQVGRIKKARNVTTRAGK